MSFLSRDNANLLCAFDCYACPCLSVLAVSNCYANLYIDMNGIIHPCSHPEVGGQPKTEEMYNNVYLYVDCLMQVRNLSFWPLMESPHMP
jgi:XRN 5'-3' exonuclease N-terminus